MRIGIVTPPNTVGLAALDTLVQEVVTAEQDGFSSYWFVQLSSAGNDILTSIAIAGQRSSQIELGTAVVPVYGRHPVALAQQATTVQIASGGRLTLGLGLSHRPVVENILGLSYDQPARYMREYLAVLRPLIEQQDVEFAGQFFNCQAGLQVEGASPFPVLIAALAPLMLRLAGEMADGTVTWMAGRRTLKTHIVPRINEAAESAGRPKPRICAALPIVVTDDPNSAGEYLNVALKRYGQLPNYRRLLDIEGAEGPADVSVLGDEAKVDEQLQALSAAGVTDFLASITPVGEDARASEARTRDFLKNWKG